MMVYIFENLSVCTPQWLESRIEKLPAWRRERVEERKKTEDKVRSVAAFLLLEVALKEQGILAVPEFAYEDRGKPYLPGYPIHFSLSHTGKAVACAIASQPVGLDVQDKMQWNPSLADRICSPEERADLGQKADKALALTALWTKKEALAKKTGKGLAENFSALEGKAFTLCHPGYCLSVTEENPKICIVTQL